MQLPKADIAGVFNMGGAAVANYVSILEPVALIPTSNLAHLLLQTARRFPDRPAIDLARAHLDLGGVRRPGAGRRRRARRARRAARRSRAAARAQLQRRAGDDVRVVDARRGLGADEFPPDAAGGRLSRAILRRGGAYLRRRLPRACGRGASGKPERAAAYFHRRRRRCDGTTLATHRRGDRAPGRCRSRRSGVVLLHLRHHRAAEGRRADARPDGIRRHQPPVRPDAGHDRARRVAGGGAAVARRRHPRAAAGGARRRHACCCPASGWTARRPGSWSSGIA